MLISWHVTLGNDPYNLCRNNIARRVESKIDLKPATHLAILDFPRFYTAIGENLQVCPVRRLRFSPITAIGV